MRSRTATRRIPARCCSAGIVSLRHCRRRRESVYPTCGVSISFCHLPSDADGRIVRDEREIVEPVERSRRRQGQGRIGGKKPGAQQKKGGGAIKKKRGQGAGEEREVERGANRAEP